MRKLTGSVVGNAVREKSVCVKNVLKKGGGLRKVVNRQA